MLVISFLPILKIYFLKNSCPEFSLTSCYFTFLVSGTLLKFKDNVFTVLMPMRVSSGNSQ